MVKATILATMKSALQYTGQFQVKFMTQPRQLRKWHEDAHSLLLSIIPIFEGVISLHYKDIMDLVLLDDKHSCRIGEPGMPVAAVESHSDHDWQKV